MNMHFFLTSGDLTQYLTGAIKYSYHLATSPGPVSARLLAPLPSLLI